MEKSKYVYRLGVVPTALLYTYPSRTITVSITTGSMAAIELAKFWLWRHAVQADLFKPEQSAAEMRSIDRSMLAALLVFGLSIGIASFNRDLAMYFWAALAPIIYLIRPNRKLR